MSNEKYSVWIEAENWAYGEWNINNGNTDVIVEFEGLSKWVASFFTYSNIATVIERNRNSGECLNGKYFWSSDMILVDEISRIRIEEVIRELLVNKQFEIIFSKID